MNNKLVSIIVALIVILTIVLAGVLFPGDVLKNIPSFSEEGWSRPKNSLQADPVFQFEPWREFAKKELASGRIPLWNDLNGSGAPFLANSINATFFPLTFIYYLLPADVGVSIINILKLFLFFFFTFLYFRSLKVTPGVAVIGAFAATFSGYMILWLSWPQTNVYLFLPLLLYATEELRLEKRYRYRWYMIITISYFFAILGNHPETLFHIFLLHGAYSVFRFWRDVKTLTAIGVSMVAGFLLGAFQLLPLLEYLKYSYVFETRSTVPQSFYIPGVSIILNAFPFLLGSPHLEYYRPIASGTNFQEVLGGFTGIIILLVALFGIFKLFKEALVKFWIAAVVVSFSLSYSIWPIKYINDLPLMSTSANHRLIAFVGFGLTVLFCLTFSHMISQKKKSLKIHITDTHFLLIALSILTGGVLLAVFLPSMLSKYIDYIPYLIWHILFILLTTMTFFWIAIRYYQKRISKKRFLLLSFFLVGLQTFGIFWNYNPLIEKKDFYPNVALVQILNQQEPGNVLEVGNPSLPAEVNLKYGISHVANNDAVEISWYRHALKNTFRERNHWGLPENISPKSLREINVSYVLSDYDITLTKKPIQKDATGVLHPLLKSSPYVLHFTPPAGRMKGIRVRTATFNRNNTCSLTAIFMNKEKDMLFKRDISCEDIRNNMFFTIQVPSLPLEQMEYIFELKSNAVDNSNAIALFGSHGKPFLELLYEQDTKNDDFTLIDKTKSTYVWKVNDRSLIEGAKSYKILYQNPQKIVLDVTMEKKADILVKKTYFPGWKASVNGTQTPIENANPFMKISLPQGSATVEITYQPFPFFLGILLSVFTALCLVIIVLRNERDNLSALYKNSLVQKKIAKIPFWQHVLVITIGLSISSVIFALAALSFPLHISNPWTSAINWFTKHSYPRYQDYVYFVFGFLSIFSVTFVIWVTWLWKKRR